MECPSCGGVDLRASDEGMLVCDTCGDHFPGYREEEMDDAFVGTSVSNRVSQLSQAMNVRARIAAAENEERMKRSAARKPVPDEEIVFCDAVLIMTKGIAKSLIDDDVLSTAVYIPLMQILAHWVRGRHSMVGLGEAKGGGRKVEHRVWAKRFHCAHILSFICLAGVYVRSPVLPRDLLRSVLTGKTPYFNAGPLFLPEEMHAVGSVRDSLLPQDIPLARHVDFGMLLYGTGEFAWPPLRAFFNGKKTLYEVSTVVSVPLGHMQMTLCRIVRYLGLPDAFGERVLRYVNLRRAAYGALEECGAPKPPKRFREKLPTDARGSGNAFSWNPGKEHDCSEWPTDRTLQVDIVNVLRICYGHSNSSRLKALHALGSDEENHEERVARMEEEWSHAVGHMREWFETGGGEDATLTSWGSLSMQAISTLRGERLERYLKFIEMTQGGIDVPIFLKTHLRSFQSVAASEPKTRNPSSKQRVRSADCEWNWAGSPSKRRRTFAGVGEHVSKSLSYGEEMVNETVGANQGMLLPKVNIKGRLSKRCRTVAWNEPVEVGMAWSMMRQFFAGSATSAISDSCRVARQREFKNLVETADRSLAMVLDYINVELGGSGHRRKKRRRREATA